MLGNSPEGQAVHVAPLPPGLTVPCAHAWHTQHSEVGTDPWHTFTTIWPREHSGVGPGVGTGVGTGVAVGGAVRNGVGGSEMVGVEVGVCSVHTPFTVPGPLPSALTVPSWLTVQLTSLGESPSVTDTV